MGRLQGALSRRPTPPANTFVCLAVFLFTLAPRVGPRLRFSILTGSVHLADFLFASLHKMLARSSNPTRKPPRLPPRSTNTKTALWDGFCLLCSSVRIRSYLLRPTLNPMIARSQTRGPRALAVLFSVFVAGFAGGGMQEYMERQGSGERLTSSRLTAQMGRSEPFNTNLPVVPRLFYPLVATVAWEIHPSASASGLFPLWLRTPKFLGAACSSHSRLRAGARGASCLGGGRNPPPSSSSSSFLRIPSSHNPLPRFH